MKTAHKKQNTNCEGGNVMSGWSTVISAPVKGAIYGDIIGSAFEFEPIHSKKFRLISEKSRFTDDTVMTLAIAKAVMESAEDYSDLSEQAVYWMQKLGRKYPDGDYGGRFLDWIFSQNPKPYNSYGNGAAMRVSPVGAIAGSVEEAKKLSRMVTEVTHNHPQGIKGAEVTAVSVFMAFDGGRKAKREISDYLEANYPDIRGIYENGGLQETYVWNETCQGSVPESIQCFLESLDYEDAIRNCVLLGGDADTMGAIAGAIAGAYYGAKLSSDEPLELLTSELREIYEEWKWFFLTHKSRKH